MNLSINYSINDLHRDFSISYHQLDTRAIIEDAINELIMTACLHFGCPVELFYKKTRKREIVLSRQMVISCVYNSTNLSLSQVGDRIAGKDHATVIHSRRTIQNLIDTDKQFRRDYEHIFKPIEDQLKMRVPQRVTVNN